MEADKKLFTILFSLFFLQAAISRKKSRQELKELLK